ncbi:MAG: Cof-type HAD-IIB family hydrolase [Mycoplasmatales bacterium]|nr:Cof-type HAD-IIB family hydrolase [Mycoplasmatales bacterium]
MNKIDSKIKAYFIDLDGTLLDVKEKHSHKISKMNLEALERAKKSGKEIVISTGRSGNQAKKYLEMVDYTYAVTGNGSIILKKNEIIQSIKISLKDSLLLIDFAKKHGLILKVDDSRTAYGSFGKFQTFLTKRIRFHPVKHFNIEMHKQYNKIVLWGLSKVKMKKVLKLLREKLPNLSIVSMGRGYVLEVSDITATKGLGNMFVANKLGLKSEEIIHIGDSMNDSTVVPHMRLIAMGNASKELKKMADFIGPNYKNGGVAKILNGDYEVNIEKES